MLGASAVPRLNTVTIRTLNGLWIFRQVNDGPIGGNAIEQRTKDDDILETVVFRSENSKRVAGSPN